jgi:hypothetical protein
MYTILRLEGDPVSWILSGVEVQTLAHELGQADTPVTVQTAAPLHGRLVLCARTAGSVALLEPPGAPGWIPSYIRMPGAHLYVSSATGPTSDFPGYALAPSADLDALELSIAEAMHHKTMMTVEVSDGANNGVLVLNGAALRLAVLCPPTPTPTPTP